MAAQSMSNKTFDRIPFQGSDGLSLYTLLRRSFSRIGLWWFKRQDYRATLKELTALSDRELDDIGIARADIAAIARQSANMATDRRL